MTMLLSHFMRLCILLPSLISALAQNTDRSSPASTSLPVSVQRAVPPCAQPCLRAAIFDRYPLVCTSPVDISCLCSRYSSLGESLGEVALGCIYASPCPLVESQAEAAYNICLGQEDTVRQTQTALTVTARSSSGSQAMASSTSLVQSNPTSTRRSASSIRPTTVRTIAAEALSTATSLTSSQQTTSATAVAGTTAAATSAPPMKPAQIAGLSVAAAAAFIIAIGLMALSAYLRRRREDNDLTEIDEEEKKGFPPDASYRRFSEGPQTIISPRDAPRQFPLVALPKQQDNPPPWTPLPAQVIYDKAAIAGSSNPYSRRGDVNDNRQPPRRPGLVRPRNSSNAPVPPEQIGLAISAGETGPSVAMSNASLQPRQRAEAKQQRPKSLRFTLDNSQRPDSIATQGTVFEEDASPTRRRSSRLLPTPPIPIPPIRALQPARPPATFNPTARPTRPVPSRSQGVHQPGLSLNIPIRHSRSLAEMAPQKPGTRPNPAAPVTIPIHLSAGPPEYMARATSANSADIENGGDIPDYYFTTDGSSPESAGPVEGRRKLQTSPRVVTIRAKKSSSTVVSRTLSRASTNVRDSISSQTSFESVGTSDPTPEDEDEGKQLSDDNQLSPVAESPISLLRYPKVPRASNQLVPRSPRSARSSQSLQSQGSPRKALVPSALLIKRLGEQEAFRLEHRLRMDSSPQRRAVEGQGKMYRQHTRSISMETGNSSSAGPSSGPKPRAHSGQWPRSPAMYDVDMVEPLRIRSRQQHPQQQQPQQQHHQHHHQHQRQWVPEPEPERTPQMEAMKSPGWVPNLTPKRHGDDLFLSVTYSKPIG